MFPKRLLFNGAYIIKRLVPLFLLALFFNVCEAKNAKTEDYPRRIVKIGFFPLSGYHMTNERGEKSGYGYEYLQYLRRYVNWKYEYSAPPNTAGPICCRCCATEK